MQNVDADFIISNNEPIEIEYTLEEGQHFDCSFEIFASGTIWGAITGNIQDQTDLQEQFATKADNSTVEELSSTITNIGNTLNSFGDIVTYDASDFATKNQGELADTALQPNDNISELTNDVGYITDSALSDYATTTDLTNGLAEKQDTISDLDTIRSNAENGQSAYTTIQNYGDVVTYNASDFATSAQGQLADTAVQPSDLASVATSGDYDDLINKPTIPTVNNSTVTFQKNGSDIETITLNQSGNSTVNYQIPTQASDINAVPTSRTINSKALTSNITLNSTDVGALPSTTTINDLTTSAQQNAINSNITSALTSQITTNKNDISDINDLIPTQASDTNQLADKSFVNSSIATNTANFIGTFNSVAELEAYSGTLTNNDYAFVETTDSAGNTLYDRYKYTTATTPASWQFEYELNNSSFTANQWASINSGANTTNIGQIATNANDISNINTTIGGYGDIVTYNASSFATASQGAKADTALQSGDNVSELNNDANYITNSDLSSYATQTDLTNGLATKQDTLIAGTDLEIVNATTPKLPAGYTELEWLQSDGDCYIDLGVISYGNDEVEQKYQRPSTFDSNVVSWFGSIQNGAVPRFSIGASSSSGIFAGFNYTKPLAEYDNNIHIISLKKVGSTYYAGFDEATGSYSPTSAATNPSINSYLFARNSSTITYDGTGTRIFYHKQNRYDGTPLLDLIPAKRDSDNALGMYDLVSNAFLGNSGTGTFTGGQEVIYPTTTTINFTNASGYTTNEGTVTSVNNIQPDADGDVTLTIPTYNAFTGADGTNAGSSGLVPAPSATDNTKYLKGDGTWATVSGSSTDVQINGTSITSQGVADILTQTAYNALNNKIATMSDLPASEIFIATYGTTTYNEIKTAIQNGKIVVCKPNSITYNLTYVTSTVYAFTYFEPDTCYIVEVTNGNLWSSGSYTYQQTSTAVTHTASTAVGNSTTPIYVNSSGVATSTGLSIENSRFDGQWTWKYLNVATNTSANSYQHDLSSYLPNDSYSYEIYLTIGCYYKSANAGFSVGTIASPNTNKTSSGNYHIYQYVSSSSRGGYCTAILPIGTSRKIYSQITAALDNSSIDLFGYRRIGTNS